MKEIVHAQEMVAKVNHNQVADEEYVHKCHYIYRT